MTEENPPKTDGEGKPGDIVLAQLTGVGATGTISTVGTVVNGIDAATGDVAIRVSAQGDRSEARLRVKAVRCRLPSRGPLPSANSANRAWRRRFVSDLRKMRPLSQ